MGACNAKVARLESIIRPRLIANTESRRFKGEDSGACVEGRMSVYGEPEDSTRAKIGASPSLWNFAMPSFQLVGLSPDHFAPLFALASEELAALGVRRVKATSKPGFPCRVSLADAEPGEELLLLPFEHQPQRSPYRASGPIYVRAGATQRTLGVGEIPEYVSLRQISLRAYDLDHMIVGAEVCAGVAVRAEIERQFADPRVSYIHLHNAKRGCFSCLVQRASEHA
jgi:hypothetical protein